MRAVAMAAVALGLFGLSGLARGADDNKDLITGTWEIAYSDAKDISVGTKLEFTKAGKVIMTVKVDGKEMTVEAGGYKVEKDIVVLTGKDNTRNDRGRIVLINKSSLVINDEAEDKVMVLKKLKAK